MNRIKDFLQSRVRKNAIRFLRETSPDKITRLGEKALIPAFQRATQMPAYAALLKARNLNYRKIKSLKAFSEQVPVFEKKDIFTNFKLPTLCVGGNLTAVKNASGTCGRSGLYSFRLNTDYNQELVTRSFDIMLEYLFRTEQKKTFVINCMPMGIMIPTTLPFMETSVRVDTALATIRNFSYNFDQTIIFGEPYFLKELIEEGIAQKIDFKAARVNVMFTEDWFSESFREYMADLMGIDCSDNDTGLICATMGIAELGLNLFHETPETIRLRRKAQYDPQLIQKLFGEDFKACPIIYQYDPRKIYLETNEEKELVFSALDRHFLCPLMRYNNKDKACLISYPRLTEILKNESLTELVPELKLPAVAVAGHSGRTIKVKGHFITPEQINQGLYDYPEAAGYTTGYFMLSNIDDRFKEGRIEVQLKKTVRKDSRVKRLLAKALLEHCNVDLKVVVYDYFDFPADFELNYEKKFTFLKPQAGADR